MVVQRQLSMRLAQRGAALLSVGVTAGVLLAATAVYLSPDVAMRLAVRDLWSNGVSVSDVELVELSPTRLVLERIVLGDGGVSIRRLTAEGALAALPEGNPLARLQVEGLTLAGRLDADGTLSVSGLPLADDDRRDSRSALPVLPFQELEITGGAISLATPWGDAATTLNGIAHASATDGLRFQGRVGGQVGPVGSVSALIDGRIEPQGQFSLGLDLGSADPAIGGVSASGVSGWGHLSGHLFEDARPVLSMQASAPLLTVGSLSLAEVAVTVSGPVDAPELAVLRAAQPDTGTALRADLLVRDEDIRLEAEIRTDDVRALAATAGVDLPLTGGMRLQADVALPGDTLASALDPSSASATGSAALRLEGVDWPDRIADGALEATAALDWRDGRLAVTGDAPWLLAVETFRGVTGPALGSIGDGGAGGPVFRMSWRDDGWTADLETAVATVEPFAWDGMTLSVPGLSVEGRISPDLTRLTVAANVALEGLLSPDVVVAAGEVDVAGVLETSDQGWRWSATGSGFAQAADLDLFGLTFPDGLALEMAPNQGDPWLTVDGGQRWRLAGEPRIDGDRLVLPDGTGLGVAWPEISLALAGTAGQIESMTAQLADGAITATAWGWAFDGVHMDAGLADPSTGAIEVALDRMRARPLADPAPVVPLVLSGLIRVEELQETLVASGTGTATGADGDLRINWSGRHEVASGVGGLTATLEPMSFAVDGLQPAALSPLAATLPVSQVSGVVDGTLVADWTETGQGTGGDLRLSGVGFSVAGIPVSGVSGDLTATSLAPLRLPAGQPISVGSIDLGIPMTNGAIAVGVDADGAIVIDEAVFDWAGGTVAAEPFVITLDGSDQAVVVAAEAVNLSALFEAIGLPELSATGSLDGRIPVRLGADTIWIDNGFLESTIPGAIRYVPEEPSAATEAGVTLLLQALRDFRYESLSMTLNGETGGETDIGLRISGANPELYDGYPIALNVNVSGELYDILRQGLAAGRYARRAEEYYRERIEGQALEDALAGDSQ